MTDSPLRDEHRPLLESHLYSFERLEILHAVRTSARPLSRADIETGSRLDTETVITVIAELAEARLVELDPVAKTVVLGAYARQHACESLMQLYQQDRIGVLSALSKIAMRRIRGMAAHAFADAFLLRKRAKRDDG